MRVCRLADRPDNTRPRAMRSSTAVRAFGWWGTLASFASAVTIELPLLRPPAVGEEGLRRLDDKPTGPDPRTCKIWQYCWKLTIPGAQLLLPLLRDLASGRGSFVFVSPHLEKQN